MLLRLARSSSTVQLTFKRFNSSVRTSFAVKEQSLSSSSHQTTRDDHSTLAIFENALRNNSKIAVKDHNAEYTYKQLMTGASKISEIVSALCEPKSKVSYLVPNEILYSAVQYGLWMNSNTAIPLSPLHPSEVLEYFITDSKSNLIVSTPAFENKLRPLAEKVNKRLLIIDQQDLFTQADDLEMKLPKTDSKFSALMLYTSGTTNKPKGVVISYDNIEAQISSLAHAWNVKDSDVILHSLPLHHVHGVVNALLLPLYVGGKVIMLPKFETEALWTHLLNIGLPQKDRVSVFMGVPTIYSYLIAEFDKLFKSKQQMAEHIRNHCSSKIRLMISGSAPLPQTIHKRWNEISGHKLLERYGMTEIGMAISNPLVEGPVKKRLPNHVGQPLPGVSIRITQNDRVMLEARGEYGKGFWSENPEESPADPDMAPDALDENSIVIGNLEVKGDSVFKEYFNKPEATKKEFTSDGWFKTGDCVAYDHKLKSFKIMGRDSVDIIKSGGYKISALHIETILLEHPKIKDVTVIGVPDDFHGQKIVAFIVYEDENVVDDANIQKSTIDSLRQWTEQKLPSYSLPDMIFKSTIKRNHMGKVNKAEILKQFMSENIDIVNEKKE